MPAPETEALKPCNVRLYEADVEEIKAEAARRGVSYQWLVRQAVREGWERMKKHDRIAGVG